MITNQIRISAQQISIFFAFVNLFFGCLKEREKGTGSTMGATGFRVDSNRLVLSGKRKLRSLFWRVRAEIRRQVKNSKSKQRLSFHYDPFSYALNFDDGNFGFFC
ncbi:pyruvate carboxylase [Salix suchowensis]|nr:pyruvate carboxylase [Salix suchowensis]